MKLWRTGSVEGVNLGRDSSSVASGSGSVSGDVVGRYPGGSRRLLFNDEIKLPLHRLGDGHSIDLVPQYAIPEEVDECFGEFTGTDVGDCWRTKTWLHVSDPFNQTTGEYITGGMTPGGSGFGWNVESEIGVGSDHQYTFGMRNSNFTYPTSSPPAVSSDPESFNFSPANPTTPLPAPQCNPNTCDRPFAVEVDYAVASYVGDGLGSDVNVVVNLYAIDAVTGGVTGLSITGGTPGADVGPSGGGGTLRFESIIHTVGGSGTGFVNPQYLGVYLQVAHSPSFNLGSNTVFNYSGSLSGLRIFDLS